MKLVLKQNFECYIHTELRKFKKGDTIDNPNKYEIKMLVDKKDVADVVKEPAREPVKKQVDNVAKKTAPKKSSRKK